MATITCLQYWSDQLRTHIIDFHCKCGKYGKSITGHLGIWWPSGNNMLRTFVACHSYQIYHSTFPATIKDKMTKVLYLLYPITICQTNPLSYFFYSGPTRATQEWITEGLSSSWRNMNISESKRFLKQLAAVDSKLVSVYSVKAKGCFCSVSVICYLSPLWQWLTWDQCAAYGRNSRLEVICQKQCTY